MSAKVSVIVNFHNSEKYLGDNGIAFGIDEFGKSAPYKDIYKYFGLESTNIKNITKKLLKK